MGKVVLILFTVFFVNNYIFAQKIPIPKNYSIIDTIIGDLDQDGINELVVVYNTAEVPDIYGNVPRELIIYKKKKFWTPWKKSKQALLGSKDGGIMGDPYKSMQIKTGILTITQTGGDSWKWTNIDKYRYQKGEFYLIGFTNNYGRPCDYWEDADFNISTGKILIQKKTEECYQDGKKVYTIEKDIIHKRGLIITLQNRKKLNWSLQDTAIKLMFN